MFFLFILIHFFIHFFIHFNSFFNSLFIFLFIIHFSIHYSFFYSLFIFYSHRNVNVLFFLFSFFKKRISKHFFQELLENLF